MLDLETRINISWDKALFLQLLSSFAPDVDMRSFHDSTNELYQFFKHKSDEEIEQQLGDIDKKLDGHIAALEKIYIPKVSISTIASEWNNLFKENPEIYSYGISYGWLESIFDLRNYRLYNHVPYHFKLGLGGHKGHFSIDEESLLKDAFNVLLKSEHYYSLLTAYGEVQTKALEKTGAKEFDSLTYTKITDIKFEVSSFSRLTIVSFYAFIEAFVNSVGYSFFKRNESILTAEEKEILNGLRKNRYLQLKSKIERFQKIIRKDKNAVLITSDDTQASEAVKAFFYEYEDLRNSAVHYSPTKTSISLKSKDWVGKATHFSEVAMELALNFWNACYPELGPPEYLGELDYKLHYGNAQNRLKRVSDIERSINIE